jgi:hypothetical protein
MRHMIRPAKGLLVLAAVTAAALVLSACRESEMGRPISFEKGTYAGKPGPVLDEATRKALRERTAGQNYSGN